MATENQRTAVGELMIRTFGPVADSLGVELGKVPQFVGRNLERLAEKFNRRDRSEKPRELSARLLRQVLDEAMYAEDEIVAEYLSGVLVTSGDGMKNDRGVSVTAVIRRLSALQLKVHYLFYSELWRHRRGERVDLRWSIERARLHVEFDLEDFMRALTLEHLNEEERRDVVGHAIWGLGREGLIDEDSWEFIVRRGEETPLGAHAHTDREPMLSFHPSPLGAELFLWGCGSGVVDQSQYLDPALDLLLSEDLAPLDSTKVLDLTGVSDGAYELENARTSADWAWILSAAKSGIDTSPGVIDFYVAVALMMTGDLDAAQACMERCAARISADDRISGLRKLDDLRVLHPARRHENWTLSEVLAQSESNA
ncbi:hypothetical protein ACPW96_22970 [Micromonospora sp. DT81.3]|uniref:hypothetical protein n=1 Tax=Micromonospora sp. DT81.3 TaxID=3416523 RepID=UPI003CF9008F